MAHFHAFPLTSSQLFEIQQEMQELRTSFIGIFGGRRRQSSGASNVLGVCLETMSTSWPTIWDIQTLSCLNVPGGAWGLVPGGGGAWWWWSWSYGVWSIVGFLLGVKSCHPIEFEPENSETIEAWKAMFLVLAISQVPKSISFINN